MKKVLWITSWFPPRVGVATIRNIKFLKYLHAFDWEAMVICPRETMEHTEASRNLLSQLNDSVKVSHGPRDPFYYFFDQREGARKNKYLAYLVNNIIPPDGHIFWALAVLFRIGRQIKQYQPDLIYTNSKPFSLNLIGAWAKYRYKLPWVTDFRDLWTLNPMSAKRFLKAYHGVVSNWLERFYLKRCDVLVVNTEESRSRMIEKYPMLINKTCVIPNGYDPDDIGARQENHKIPRTLFYGGTIDRKTDYTPLPLLDLLAKLPNDADQYSTWELHYGGSDGETLVDLAGEVGLKIKCKTHGYLEQTRFYSLIQRMEYVMLCMPLGVESKSWVPARFYDYIGNGSRIICLAHSDSEVSRLLERYGDSIVLLYDEPEEQRIEKLHTYLSHGSNNRKTGGEFAKHFNRRELTGRLAQVFEQVEGREQGIKPGESQRPQS